MKKLIPLFLIIVLTSSTHAIGFRKAASGGVSDHSALTSSGTLTHTQIETKLTNVAISTGTLVPYTTINAVPTSILLPNGYLSFYDTGTSPIQSMISGQRGIINIDAYNSYTKGQLNIGAKTYQNGNFYLGVYGSEKSTWTATTGSLITAGSITASSFYGDGSNLSGVSATSLLSSTNNWTAPQIMAKPLVIGATAQLFPDLYSLDVAGKAIFRDGLFVRSPNGMMIWDTRSSSGAVYAIQIDTETWNSETVILSGTTHYVRVSNGNDAAWNFDLVKLYAQSPHFTGDTSVKSIRLSDYGDFNDTFWGLGASAIPTDGGLLEGLWMGNMVDAKGLILSTSGCLNVGSSSAGNLNYTRPDIKLIVAGNISNTGYGIATSSITFADGTVMTSTSAFGGGTTGVTQLIAGTNISLSPAGGTGVVTVNASGSVSSIDADCRVSTGIIKAQIDSVAVSTGVNAANILAVQRSTYTQASIAITTAQVSGITLYAQTAALSGYALNRDTFSVASILNSSNTYTGTNTHTNPIVINSTGTAAAISLNIYGNPGAYSQSGIGGITVKNNIDCAPAPLAVFVDSTTDAQLGHAIVEIRSDNPNHNDPAFWIKQVGYNSAPQIRLDAPAPNMEFVSKSSDGVHGMGKCEIAIPYESDILQFNSRNNADTSFDNMAYFRPLQKYGSGLYLRAQEITGNTAVLTSSDTGTMYMFSQNNRTMGITCPLYLGTSFVWSMPAEYNSAGQVMYQLNNGRGGPNNARQLAMMSGGVAGNLMQYNGTAAPTWVSSIGISSITLTGIITLKDGTTITSTSTFVTVGSGATNAAAGNHTHTGYALVSDTKTVGVDVQAYDADLADLADGSLTGSKVGSGIVAANIASGNLGSGVVAQNIAAGTYAIAVTSAAYLTNVGWTTYIAITSTQTWMTNISTQVVSGIVAKDVNLSSVTFAINGGTSAKIRIFIRTANGIFTTAGTAVLTAGVSVTGGNMTGGTFSATALPAGSCIVMVVDEIVGAVRQIVVDIKGTR